MSSSNSEQLYLSIGFLEISSDFLASHSHLMLVLASSYLFASPLEWVDNPSNSISLLEIWIFKIHV